MSNIETAKPSTTGTDFSITLPYFPDPLWIPTSASFPGKWSLLVNQIKQFIIYILHPICLMCSANSAYSQNTLAIPEIKVFSCYHLVSHNCHTLAFTATTHNISATWFKSQHFSQIQPNKNKIRVSGDSANNIQQ